MTIKRVSFMLNHAPYNLTSMTVRSLIKSACEMEVAVQGW